MIRTKLIHRIATNSVIAASFTAFVIPTVNAAISAETHAAFAAESVQGLWEQKYEFMGVPMVDRYELTKSDSGEYSGKLTRDGKEISKLEEIKFEGDKVTFVARGKSEGTDWKVEFAGTVKGDEIDGKVKISVNDQTFETPWKPNRIKQNK